MHFTETENAEKDNCLVCCLKTLLFLSKICGIPLTSTCPHQRPNAEAPKMTISRFYQCLPVVFLIPQVLHIRYTIQRYNECTEIVKCLEILITITLFVYMVIIWFLIQWKAKEKLTQFEGLLFILENRFYYGIDSFITTNIKKSFRVATYCFVMYVMMTEIFFLLNHDKNRNEVFSYQFLMDFIASTTSYYLEAVFVYQTYVFGVLYANLYEKCLKELKLSFALTLRRGGKDKKLGRFLRLYLDITTTYNQLRHVLNPILLLWNVTGTLMLILVFFYIFLGYARSVALNYILLLHSYGFIMGLLWYLISGERMQGVADGLLSFLYKHRISKLSYGEATQIELFIITLRIHKPILIASDMFTLGTKLLSSISGTVVTYVLVALQFYATWQK